MKNDVPCRVAGPAVTAFDAQMEAEAAGVLFTPDQWSFARRSPPGEPIVEPAGTTRRIPAETLEELLRQCKKSLVRTCPARRK